MQSSLLEIVRCPRCRTNSLTSREATESDSLIEMPAWCEACHLGFPIHEGLLDLVTTMTRQRVSPVQQALELAWVAKSWERYVRPAVDALVTRNILDEESQYTALRSLVGEPTHPIVDLGCGSGAVMRRLATDFGHATIVGVDVSVAMLKEAMAHCSQLPGSVEFVRADVPPLPFVNQSLDSIVAAYFIHQVSDLDVLFREISRVLRPRGRIVATSYESTKLVQPLHRQAGFFPRTVEMIREAADRAGLIRFERIKIGSLTIWKAESP